MLFRSRSAGDFESLCAPYASMVYHHCLHMLRDPAEAEDAAQEAMLRAFRSFETCRGSGVASWLYRIAHNTCLDILRSARVRRETVTAEEQFPVMTDPGETPDQHYERTSSQEMLWQAVSRLPEEQQLALQLYYGEGRSYTEIAEMLGVREGTLKSRMNRARETLKKDARLASLFDGT